MDTYKKLHVMTQGGYGTIYKALDKEGEEVVLKEIIIVHLTEQKLEMARREVELHRALNHPHIVSYLDYWETREILTIAMEYAECGSLETLINQRQGKLYGESEALQIFVQVLSAVEYLHRSQIIHRDICARNVLAFSGGLVKLCDFGVSRRFKSARSGSLKGDPSHFAPELCHGRKCSEETDMWALGCLLHHLLSLKPPFRSASLAGLLVTVLTGPPPPLPDGYSGPLGNLIFSLLSSEPSQRPKAKVLLAHPLLARHVHSLDQVFSQSFLPPRVPDDI